MTGDGGSFAVAPLIREIGRGKDGARALSRTAARDLMAGIATGAVDDLALGAVLLALRMKGESAAELAGFRDALEPELRRVAAHLPGWVIIPSYNGARTVPNLVPLLSFLLARAGVATLVHGQASEPMARGRARVTSAEVFAAMEHPMDADVAAASRRAAAGQPALLPLAALSPTLARLVALRPRLGVRNVAHTLAKLVRPAHGPSLLLASFTHPAFGALQAELFRDSGELALCLRATDGEAVASARRTQALELWRDGIGRSVVATQEVAPAQEDLPALDAASTAAWTREVLAGRRPIPAAVQAQLRVIREALQPGPG